jgi:hypothetical protein
MTDPTTRPGPLYSSGGNSDALGRPVPLRPAGCTCPAGALSTSCGLPAHRYAADDAARGRRLPDDLAGEDRYRAAAAVLDVFRRRGQSITVQAALEAVDAVLDATGADLEDGARVERVRALAGVWRHAGIGGALTDQLDAALGAYPCHRAHWQAWRDQAPPETFAS